MQTNKYVCQLRLEILPQLSNLHRLQSQSIQWRQSESESVYEHKHLYTADSLKQPGEHRLVGAKLDCSICARNRSNRN